MFSSSLQFRQTAEENIDDAIDQISQLKKAWDERLTLENPRFAERYFKMKLRLHVHVRSIPKAGFDPVDFCAIFQRKGFVERSVVKADVFGLERQIDDRTVRAAASNLHDLDRFWSVNDRIAGCAYCYEKAVLIDDVESMNGEKTLIPSLVWFQRFDHAHRSIAGSIYFSLQTGFEVIDAEQADRELGSVIGLSAISFDKLPREMIEGGPEIVNCIASDGGPSPGKLSLDANAKDPIAGLLLILSNDRIGLAFQKGVDFRFEVFDVLLGPLDLDFDGSDAR